MELTTFFQTIYLNLHEVLTLFALGTGSFAVAVFVYQVWLEQHRKQSNGQRDDFAVFDE